MFSKMTYRTQMILVATLASLLTFVGIVGVAYLFMIKPSSQHKAEVVRQATESMANILAQQLLAKGELQTGPELMVLKKDQAPLPFEEVFPGIKTIEQKGMFLAVVDQNGNVLWPDSGRFTPASSFHGHFAEKGRALNPDMMHGLSHLEVAGKHYLGSTAPLKGNLLFVGYPETVLSVPIASVVFGNIGFVIVIFAMVFAALWLVASPMRRLTGETAGAMWALAEGDLAYKMEEKGLAEERMFRRQFNRAVEKLRNFMIQLNHLARDVHAAVSQSASAAEQTGKAIQEQQERVEAGSAALEEVSASVEEVAVSVQTATDLSSEARSLASEGETSVESVSEKADTTRKAMEQLVEEVGRLERVAGEINAALNLINDISEETNLLSLNAAIEASRAGEAGRGFAVVADEIRNLAERSMSSAREVKQVVEGITASLKDVVSSIKQGAELVQDLSGDIQGMRMTFHLIVNSVDQVADRMLAVSTATEEQTQVIAELSSQMAEITNSGGEIAAASQQLSRTSEEIKERMEHLRQMLDQFMGLEDKTENP